MIARIVCPIVLNFATVQVCGSYPSSRVLPQTRLLKIVGSANRPRGCLLCSRETIERNCPRACQSLSIDVASHPGLQPAATTDQVIHFPCIHRVEPIVGRGISQFIEDRCIWLKTSIHVASYALIFPIATPYVGCVLHFISRVVVGIILGAVQPIEWNCPCRNW